LGSKLIAQARGKYSISGTCNVEFDGRSDWHFEDMDIGSKESVEKVFEKVRPELVILAAAMTDIDACEKDPVKANRVNAVGPGLVARACKTHASRLVHVSTDNVFDGQKPAKYREEDVARPFSAYGTTKLAGERAVHSILPGAAVARTAVLYGWNPLTDRGNFVTLVLKKLRAGEKATQFQDQWISPTFADDLARALLELAEKDVSGTWHVAGPDCLDRPGCGRLIAKVFELDEKLIMPVPSSSVSLPVRRPKNSCLDVSKIEKLLIRRMFSFEQGLTRMKEQEPKTR
jgi:dTDP-4-dehydrorhamnose reductase